MARDIASGSRWTDTEIREAVAAYLWMLQEEQHGRRYSKAQVNEQLRKGALSKRSRASIEYRMQNISAILEQAGFPRIKGYVPAKSVGQGVADEIWKALEALGFSKQTDYHSAVPGEVLENRVKRIRLRKQILRPVGQAKPETRKSERTEYLRDPAVKAWVLEKAAGICELCGKPAPFVTDEGLPYLEHHHVIPLAEGGPDTVENSVALCPNCHRMCHAGKERTDARRKLLERVKRRGCTGN